MPRLSLLPSARQERHPPGDRHGRAPAVRGSPRARGRDAEALVSREQRGAGPGHGAEGSGRCGAGRPGADPRASAPPPTRARPRRGPGTRV